MKIGIFYGSTTGNTHAAAEIIADCLDEYDCTLNDVQHIQADDLLGYDLLIMGIPTWYVGEPQDDWIPILEALESVSFDGTRFAVFGHGDQVDYANNFQDGLGMLYEKMIQRGATGQLGFTSTEGYTFNASKGIIDGQFCGLALDDDNQPDLTEERIETWCEALMNQLNTA